MRFKELSTSLMCRWIVTLDDLALLIGLSMQYLLLVSALWVNSHLTLESMNSALRLVYVVLEVDLVLLSICMLEIKLVS